MKVVCDRSALVESLALVSGVVVSRTPKPVLRCVEIIADDQGLTLCATDMEVAVRVASPRVEVTQAGKILIPADTLSQIVRESIDPTLTIESDGQAVHIRGQDSHFKVFGYSTEDFPDVPTFQGDADFEIQAGEFRRMISQTIFAAARENSRYAINGVLVEREASQLTVVSTDGRRLALAKGQCQAEQGGSLAIVPTKGLQLFMKIFNDPEQVVSVQFKDNQVLFSSQGAFLVSNLVEGNFPPYADVIPRDSSIRATISKDILMSAVRRAALLTNEESKGVRFGFSDQGLTLKSRAPEMGESEIKVTLTGFEGEAIEIGFNPQYVTDALKVVQGDEVHIDFKAPSKPSVMHTGEEFLYVIMPVNL